MAKALPFDPARDKRDVIEVTVRVPIIRRPCAYCGKEMIVLTTKRRMSGVVLKGRSASAMFCHGSCKVLAFRRREVEREAEELARLRRVTRS
jgi:hypothetical protein